MGAGLPSPTRKLGGRGAQVAIYIPIQYLEYYNLLVKDNFGVL